MKEPKMPEQNTRHTRDGNASRVPPRSKTAFPATWPVGRSFYVAAYHQNIHIHGENHM